MEPVGAPLPYVSAHLITTPLRSSRGVVPHGCGGVDAAIDVVPTTVVMPFAAPWIRSPILAPRRLFPFELGGESDPGPFALIQGILPGDIDYRVVREFLGKIPTGPHREP